MQILENAQAWQNHYQTKVLSSNPEDQKPNFNAYQYAKNTSSPAGKGEALTKVRLLFISSSGAYIPEQQAPFDAKNPLGDYTLRAIPTTTCLNRLDFTHAHYDQTAVREDPQTLIPLGHLKQKVKKGQLGGLTRNWLSFMGYQPDASRVVKETLPQIIDFAITEKANGALLVPA